MKAVLILALVAAAFVASEAAVCHTSSYKVPLSLATSNKKAMYAACKQANKIAVSPVITSSKVMPDGCSVIVQKVPSTAAWEAYSNCEKSKTGLDNKKYYEPLSSAGAPCTKYKMSMTC
ncbi:hypothetical protein COO60DRAFT_1557804 [Scenedesmus sp. NREL 46B-D3]|nr:hypothetical protein COO60DRAFT_1557804 [Scenedesmus sp. NREL 46B-D3]